MATEPTEERVTVPLAEEYVTVHKTAHVTGGVRVRKTVQETLQNIDETVNVQNVTVQRVPIGRWIDRPLSERQEGDTTIIPIIEEVAVIETRLRLVEEIRVTRTDAVRHLRTAVPIRREQVVVEDLSTDGDASRSEERREHRQAVRQPVRQPMPRRISMTTIIGLFTDSNAASQARKAVLGVSGKDAEVRIFDAGANGSADELRDSLSGLGIDDQDVRALTGSLDRGASIVSAAVSGDRADEVAAAMTRSGAKGTDIYDGPNEADTQILQEVEETMGVTKKATASGVRARTTVTERPVQQTVTLRDETVEARRREVDRDLSAEEADAAFEEKTVEVTGLSEEAEIRKAARLIGEVEITKTSQDRKETVRDTVRKTEVETEKTGPRGGSRRG